MPTLIIEDGSVVDGANSYDTVEEADAYLATRPTKWAEFWLSALDQDRKMVFLIDAARLMDVMAWLGESMREGEGLALPRSGLLDRAGRPVASDVILQCQKDFQAETAAWRAFHGPQEDGEAPLRSATFGKNSWEYARPSKTPVLPPYGLASIAHLLRSHGRVERVG